MAFSNDIVGGTTLLRPAIRSPNYIPGVAGWTINRDGTSEFASGTFRGPVVVIDPATGNVLASIGANGNGSFQYVYATNDVIIGTLSVLAAITNTGRGVVGRFSTVGALPNIPGANTLADIAWVPWTVDSTRYYRITVCGGRINNTNGVNSENFDAKLVIAQTGGFNGTAVQTRFSDIGPGSQVQIYVSTIITLSNNGPATIKLQMSNDSASTAYPIVTSDNFMFTVEDIGPNNGVTGGGSGSPAGTQTFTKQYFGTASQVYDGNTGNSESDPNNMYIGGLSGRSHGTDEASVWSFPGSTIRSDLSGATNITAKVWMYCTASSGASGSVNLGWVTNTTPPSTRPGSTITNNTFTNVWPVPGWASVDITGSILNTGIISGLANSAMLQKTVFTGSASWFGAANATFKPYIEITYSK